MTRTELSIGLEDPFQVFGDLLPLGRGRILALICVPQTAYGARLADHLLVAFAVDVLLDHEGRTVGPDLSEMVRARLPWELCETA